MALSLSGFEADVAYGRMAGLRGGAPGAPRVLALHGWLDNAASFRPLAHHLDGIDLVAPDLPGHGASAHLPPGADYSFPFMVHALLDLTDALGWDRFAILGHSMGAGIGSLIAAGVPGRVTRFVAIEALGALGETVAHTVPRMREAFAATRALKTKSLRVFPDVDTAVRARMLANGLGEPAARLLVERGVERTTGGWRWRSDPRQTLPGSTRLTEPQIDALVAGIGCPTRVIHADPPQPYLPGPVRERRAALLPDGELVVLDGIHHLHMEDPQGVAAAIGGFLVAEASAR